MVKTSVAFVLVCTVALHAFDWPWQDNDRKTQEKQASETEVAAEPTDRDLAVTLTYLDTLNRGHEISLQRKDITPIIVEKTPTAPNPTQPKQSPQKNAAPTGVFRVQVLATSDIQNARAVKRTLEAEVKHPVHIFLDTPYYKLQVGEFRSRAKAERVLADLMNQGYKDAWIVKPQPQ